MKSAATFSLVILASLLMVAGLILGTIRLQLLNPSFWENSFSRHDIYANLSAELKKSLENQTSQEGGSVNDVRVLTNIITPLNVKDLIDKNLVNILGYADGLLPGLNFYVPISKIPKGLLPASLAKLPEQVPVATILSEFNISFITPAQIRSFSLFGKIVSYLAAGVYAITAIFLILIFTISEGGKRFFAPGFVFLISGILMLGLFEAGQSANSALIANLAGQTVTAEVILGIIAPPLITDLANTWLVLGGILVLIGIILFFIKKPL